MFERSATMSSRPSVILAMVRRALMMLVAALMIAIGSIVGLSPGVEASSMTAVEMRTSRVARDAALAVFAERQRVRDEPGYAKVIEFPHFAAAQAGRATSLPGRTTRRRDSVMAARDVAALDAGTSTYGYDFASRPTTASQFVATETGGAGAVGDGVSKPSGVPDFVDPSKSPGAGWEWRGKGEPGSGKGSWYNPGTGESLHPDLNHPVGGTVEGPRYDWKDAAGNNHRVYPGGKIVKK